MRTEYREFTEEDLKWIKRFKRVMKDAPPQLFMFVGSGSVIIYSERAMKTGNGGDVVDNRCPGEFIETEMECDGGDW